MKKLIPVFLLLCIMASCNNPVATTLTSKSPDGKTVVTINAKKESPLEPFTINMVVKSGDIPEGGLEFEITASQLDSKNVTFDWKDSQNCLITFIQGDGDKRLFSLQATETNVYVQEVRKAE